MESRVLTDPAPREAKAVAWLQHSQGFASGLGSAQAQPPPDLSQWTRPPAPHDWEALPVSRRVNRTDLDDLSLWVPDPETPTLF